MALFPGQVEALHPVCLLCWGRFQFVQFLLSFEEPASLKRSTVLE